MEPRGAFATLARGRSIGLLFGRSNKNRVAQLQRRACHVELNLTHPLQLRCQPVFGQLRVADHLVHHQSRREGQGQYANDGVGDPGLEPFSQTWRGLVLVILQETLFVGPVAALITSVVRLWLSNYW
jgi:hypothetical protein